MALADLHNNRSNLIQLLTIFCRLQYGLSLLDWNQIRNQTQTCLRDDLFLAMEAPGENDATIN